MKNRKLQALFFLILSSFFHNQTAIAGNSGFNIKQFASDFAETFGKDWIAHLAHRFGTYLAVKILNNHPIEGHMGTNAYDNHKLFNLNLIDQGGDSFSIHSFLPIGCWTDIRGRTLNSRQSSTPRDVAILLAGPLCGALAYYLINVYKNYKKHGGSKEEVQAGKAWSWEKICLYSLIDIDHFYHLVHNLTPYKKNNGAKIVKKLFDIPRTNNMDNIGYSLLKSGAEIGTVEFLRYIREETLGDGARFVQKDVVTTGNRMLMELTNKSLCALKRYIINGQVSLAGTDFDKSDIIKLLYLFFAYKPAAKQLYNN